jgi:hypothetical protein
METTKPAIGANRKKVYIVNLNTFVTEGMSNEVKRRSAELGYPSYSTYVRALVRAGLSADLPFNE